MTNRAFTQTNICIQCRKAFKKTMRSTDDQLYSCPQCGLTMRPVGPTFRTPSRIDVKGWKQVKLLLAKGSQFIEDEKTSRPFHSSEKKRHNPKGMISIFQVPAKKRNRY